MAKTQTKTTQKPLVQIDDLIREMTDEEYENHLTLIANYSLLTAE